MCLLNVQGLVGKTYNKLEDEEMQRLFMSHKILLFTETWLNDFYNYDVPNFHSFILNRDKRVGSKRSSGGVIVYIHDSLKRHVDFVKNSDDCIIWIKIKGNLFNLERDILLCLTHNVPHGSSRFLLSENNL